MLVLPFLLSRRWRAAILAILLTAVLACIPFLLYRRTWSSYLDSGVHAIRVSVARADNASILNLADRLGVSRTYALAILTLLAMVLAIVIRDLFWPAAWLMVAALPVAWMYSLLGLMPIAVVSLRRRSAIATGALVMSIALCVGSPPLGLWPGRLLPIIVALSAVAMTGIVEADFWPDRSKLAQVLETARAWPVNAMSTLHRPLVRRGCRAGHSPDVPVVGLDRESTQTSRPEDEARVETQR